MLVLNLCTPLQTILCMGLMLPRLENICDVTQSLSRSLNRRFPSSALRGRRRRCQFVLRLPLQLLTAPTRPPTRADCTDSTRCAACRDLQQNNCTVVFKQTRDIQSLCSFATHPSPPGCLGAGSTRELRVGNGFVPPSSTSAHLHPHQVW